MDMDLTLDEKIDIFKKYGVSNLQIISDFDGTLTYGLDSNGNIANNSISVFRNEGYLGEEYVRQSKELADIYKPIENDPSIDEVKKDHYMREWWGKHFALLVKYGMNKKVIQEVVYNNQLKLRAGFEDLIDKINSNNIPFLVFSAGVGELIRAYFENLGCYKSNVHLISNFWRFNSVGEFIGLEGEIIHSHNKNMFEVEKHDYFKEVVNRKNILLLGDSLGDLKMAQGFNYDLVLSVGFCNSSDLELRSKFEDKYDLVLYDDPSLERIIEILDSIIGL